MNDAVHQPPDHRDQAGHFRMTLRLPPDAAAALDSLAPRGERCDLIAYLLRCELRRQGLDTTLVRMDCAKAAHRSEA